MLAVVMDASDPPKDWSENIRLVERPKAPPTPTNGNGATAMLLTELAELRLQVAEKDREIESQRAMLEEREGEVRSFMLRARSAEAEVYVAREEAKEELAKIKAFAKKGTLDAARRVLKKHVNNPEMVQKVVAELQGDVNSLIDSLSLLAHTDEGKADTREVRRVEKREAARSLSAAFQALSKGERRRTSMLDEGDEVTEIGVESLHQEAALSKAQEMGLVNQDADEETALAKALLKACMGGREVQAALLLQAGAGPHAVGAMGFTSLMFACKGGHGGIVELLLQRFGGAVLVARDRFGNTPLHYAASEGFTHICSMLVEVGGESLLFEEDELGRTCLMYAAAAGYKDTCQLLLAAGGQRLLDVVNKSEQSARDVAKSLRYFDVVELLEVPLEV